MSTEPWLAARVLTRGSSWPSRAFTAKTEHPVPTGWLPVLACTRERLLQSRYERRIFSACRRIPAAWHRKGHREISMDHEKSKRDTAPVARRDFLLGAGTAVAAGLSTAATSEAQPQAAPASSPAASTPAKEPDQVVTLTASEAAFIVAAVDTIIPADELSPAGSDCGVAVFIDRQLGSAWGGGAKMYRSGPFLKGKPEQGYQLALTPREYFTAGIAAANEWTRKAYGKDFDRLSAAQ